MIVRETTKRMAEFSVQFHLKSGVSNLVGTVPVRLTVRELSKVQFQGILMLLSLTGRVRLLHISHAS